MRGGPDIERRRVEQRIRTAADRWRRVNRQPLLRRRGGCPGADRRDPGLRAAGGGQLVDSECNGIGAGKDHPVRRRRTIRRLRCHSVDSQGRSMQHRRAGVLKAADKALALAGRSGDQDATAEERPRCTHWTLARISPAPCASRSSATATPSAGPSARDERPSARRTRRPSRLATSARSQIPSSSSSA